MKPGKSPLLKGKFFLIQIHEPTRKLCIHDLARCHRPNKMWYALNSHDFKNLFKGFDNTLLPKGLLFCSISNLLAQCVPYDSSYDMRNKELNIFFRNLSWTGVWIQLISFKFVTIVKETIQQNLQLPTKTNPRLSLDVIFSNDMSLNTTIPQSHNFHSDVR